MALSRYDPLGTALYDPFSLFLGAPMGGMMSGGQVSSSSRGGQMQQQQQLSTSFVRPLHLDVKGCFCFFSAHEKNTSRIF
jgi:hypothetical protein